MNRRYRIFGTTTCLVLGLIVHASSVHAVEVIGNQDLVSIQNEAFCLSYDLKVGTYSGVDIASGRQVFSKARFTVDELDWNQVKGVKREWKVEEIEDAFGKGKKLLLTETPLGGYRLTKTLQISVYDGRPFAVLGFSVKNPSAITARIARMGMLDQASFLPKAMLEDLRVLQGGAGAQPNRVQTELWIQAHNNLLVTGKLEGKRQSMVVGGLRYRDFLRKIEFNQRKNALAVTIEDPQGKPIAPGETYEGVDTVYLDFVTRDPFVSLEQYGMAMREANGARPKPYDFPTLCGWLVSMPSYGEGMPINNSRDLVGQMELAKKSGILNYTPVAIRLEPDYYCQESYGDTQQGWWDDEHWAKYGSLTPPYETYGKFCGKIRELGGIPFTYIQSNMPSNDFAMKHPEWMLNNDISRLHAEHRHHMPFVKFDFTEPAFQEHVLNTWKRLRQQGLGGIKFDYPESSWCDQGGFEDKSYSTTNAYRKMYQLCREGLGDEAFIHERNLGEYGTPCLDVTAGIVDLQRVWADSSHFEPEMASRIGLRWYKHRSVFGYYPDGKSFKGMDRDQRRTMLTQVGLISGRIELGTSFGRMTPEERHDLTRLYPIMKGTRSFRPVDMLTSAPADPSVYVYQVDADWSQLILCNNQDKPLELRVPISGDQADTGSLGHAAEGSYYLYDFWNDRLLGELKGSDSMSVVLKPYQALSYSLHRKHDQPQFLSTNRHILQGMMDLSEVKWDEKALTYSGVAAVVGGEPFEIVIAGNGHQAVEAKATEGSVEIKALDAGLVRLTIRSAKNAPIAWSMRWEKRR